MYHFFTHSSVDRHLDCIHVLTIVKSVALNTGVYCDFQIMVFSGSMPRSGIARAYGSSVFTFFKEPPEWFLVSRVAVLIYIPTNRLRGDGPCFLIRASHLLNLITYFFEFKSAIFLLVLPILSSSLFQILMV